MNPAISPLHSEYCARTGMDISMNMLRERVWSEWLMFNKPSFTVEDIKLVIAYLRSQIRINKRNEGSLRFTNLIGQPDRFEEDVQLAKQWRNEHRSRFNGGGSQNSKPQPKTEDTGERVTVEEFEAMKAETLNQKPSPP